MNKRISIKLSTFALFILAAIGLMVGSFFVGKTVASNNPTPSSVTNSTEVSNAREGASSHSPRETYEAGWRACMRCWSINSEEGLDYDNATNLVFYTESGYGTKSKEVKVSEYYSVTDIKSARELFFIGFNQCCKYWNISYTYSNRSGEDDLAYAFNSWY